MAPDAAAGLVKPVTIGDTYNILWQENELKRGNNKWHSFANFAG
jgi:hypothetical protein